MNVPSSSSRPRPLRWILCGTAAALAVVFGASLILRDRTPALDLERLERNRRLWRRAGLDDYDLRLRRQADRQKVEEFVVSVRAGNIVRLERNGRELQPNPAYGIDGLFRIMRRELEMAATSDPGAPAFRPGQRQTAVIRATFHDSLGVPLELKVIASRSQSFVVTVDEIRVPGRGRVHP